VLALLHENVWIELSGLPPHRLPHYYARFDLTRLARKFIFGTDWPGVPGIARNARALAGLGLGEDVLAGVLAGHAVKVYPGLTNVLQSIDVTL
jgi:predicted TIM-barrel fold metal-dependent hydrolase